MLLQVAKAGCVPHLDSLPVTSASCRSCPTYPSCTHVGRGNSCPNNGVQSAYSCESIYLRAEAMAEGPWQNRTKSPHNAQRISRLHSSRERRNARQTFLLGCDSPCRGIWSAVVHREGALTDSAKGAGPCASKRVSKPCLFLFSVRTYALR